MVHPVYFVPNLKLILNTNPVQELDIELGGVDGYLTMFGMHYVGMFANPRMRVLFDTRKRFPTTLWVISRFLQTWSKRWALGCVIVPPLPVETSMQYHKTLDPTF